MSRSRFPGRQSLLKVNHYSMLRPTTSASSAFRRRGSVATTDPTLPLRGRPPKRVKTAYMSAAFRHQHQHQLQAPSFIMKLFDRSVDLAKFTAGCPLYPVCRAWWRNQPRIRTAPPSKSAGSRPAEPAPREHQPDIVDRYNRREVTDIRNMPQAAAESELEPYLVQERFPPAEPEEDPVPDDEDSAVSRSELLLRAHKQRWTKIRRQWQSHRQNYLKKYQLSYDLLDAIVMKQI